MRKTKQTRKPRKVAKKTRKSRKSTIPPVDAKKVLEESFKKHPMAISNVEFEETPHTAPEIITITIPKDRAVRLAHDISDLLCWWQGFKAAVRLVNPDGVYTDMAQNGIEAAQDLNYMLKNKTK